MKNRRMRRAAGFKPGNVFWSYRKGAPELPDVRYVRPTVEEVRQLKDKLNVPVEDPAPSTSSGRNQETRLLRARRGPLKGEKEDKSEV